MASASAGPSRRSPRTATVPGGSEPARRTSALTWCPPSSSCAHSPRPMNPLAPVTNVRIDASLPELRRWKSSTTGGRARLVAGVIDIHCHVLPGLDDGPPSMPGALALAEAALAAGTTTLVATPHIDHTW